MDYKQQLDKVITFIGKHLDDELNLTQLSQLACFSKYHWPLHALALPDRVLKKIYRKNALKILSEGANR